MDVFRNASLLLLSGLGLENEEVERREEGGQRKGVRENDRRGRERKGQKERAGGGGGSAGERDRETENTPAEDLRTFPYLSSRSETESMTRLCVYV